MLPVPRSFHCFVPSSNRYNLHRSENKMSSFSSPVGISSNSGNVTRGVNSILVSGEPTENDGDCCGSSSVFDNDAEGGVVSNDANNGVALL